MICVWCLVLGHASWRRRKFFTPRSKEMSSKGEKENNHRFNVVWCVETPTMAGNFFVSLL